MILTSVAGLPVNTSILLLACAELRANVPPADTSSTSCENWYRILRPYPTENQPVEPVHSNIRDSLGCRLSALCPSIAPPADGVIVTRPEPEFLM